MKINKRTAICFGIFFVLFLMTVGNATAVQEDGIRTRIISNEAEQGNPDIDGDRIVWQDSRNGGSGYSWDPTGNWDIYMYDLSTSTETQITTNNSTQKLPAIYEDRIVWEDNRNGNWDIYMYDLSTSMETRITANESNQSEPAIYEDKIVWQDDRNGNWDIYMYDLSTSKETRITTNESNQSEPAIYGDKIVWVDELRIDDPEIAVDPYFSINNFICVYDLSTSTETRLPSGLRIWNPSIYGDIIVWDQEDSIADNNMIVMYDLSTSTSNMIAIERTASPDIYEDRIVWTQDFWDFRNHVLMYNISTSTQTELTAEGDESGSGISPAIYGDRIIWVPSNGGIYMFTLAPDEVPELPVADFSANITSGYAPLSVQFTDLSENATEWNWDFGDGATSIEQNPVHIYSVAGNYTVNQTVSNENGTDSKLVTINVSEKTAPDDNNTDEGNGTGHETEGTETQITTNNSDQLFPEIYEDRIVWTDWRNDNGNHTNLDIYMYNISTSTETQITTNESNQMRATIYGDRIAWTDDRNGNEDIYMYDLSTSTETQITTNESNQYGPAIYEDRIVWLDGRNSGSVPDDGFGGFDVYMYDLSTKKETRITKSTISINPDYGASVNIYDNKIVCDMGPYGISAYDLSTRQENVISDLQLYNLAFSGNRIVGTTDREGREGAVYMCDLSTATKTKITADFSAYGGPDISGNRIVWPDFRNSDQPGELDLYMYDLSTSTESRITTSKSVAWSTPSIYGDRIVWTDVRNGNYDIYMFTLASAEVPPLDDNDTNEGNGTGNETQVPDNCSAELMPLDNIQALKEYVECTYKCHVMTKTGLATLLDASMCYWENGEDEKAISMLKSFIHLAERMKECRQISADEADYMVREAKEILDQMDERDGKANVAYEVCDKTEPVCEVIKPVCEETKPVCKPACE